MFNFRHTKKKLLLRRSLNYQYIVSNYYIPKVLLIQTQTWLFWASPIQTSYTCLIQSVSGNFQGLIFHSLSGQPIPESDYPQGSAVLFTRVTIFAALLTNMSCWAQQLDSSWTYSYLSSLMLTLSFRNGKKITNWQTNTSRSHTKIVRKNYSGKRWGNMQWGRYISCMLIKNISNFDQIC